MMRTKFGTCCLALSLIATLTACGDGNQPSSSAARSSNESDEAAGGACRLLTREQVDAVVPGNDGGSEDAGLTAGLLKEVETSGCRYLHADEADLRYLTVTVYRAQTDKGFADIDIGYMAKKSSPRKLDIADIAFIDTIDEGWITLSASKGKTVFLLELHSKDAPAKSEQLIALARIVAGEL